MPMAVARCVLPVPGPPMNTTFCGIIHELPGVQAPDQFPIDPRLGKAEASQIAVRREAAAVI